MTPPLPDSNPATYRGLLALLPALPPGAAVLDAPCGSGAMAWELARRGCRVTPRDAFPEKYALPEPPCARLDMNGTFPFEDASFDAAVFCEGPQVLENAGGALREFSRVLKPGGVLLIALPNVSSLFSRLRFLFTGFYNKFIRPYNELEGEGNFHPMAYPELRYLLRRNGFRVEALRTNRFKLSHLLPLPLAPLVWAATGLTVLQKCRGPMRGPGLEIWRETTSFNLLFGEAVLLRACKIAPPR